jgi:hypothetical protein
MMLMRLPAEKNFSFHRPGSGLPKLLHQKVCLALFRPLLYHQNKMYYRTLEEFMNANGYVINGEWYPRVTSIVTIKAKPALYKFYGDAASFSDALSTSRNSASEGTRIHEAVEAILAGKPIEVEKEIQPAIDAFSAFCQKYEVKVNPAALEKRIWEENHRYAGTVDAIARLDGKPGVLDIKTSSGIWRDYNLQTAAYMAALQTKEPWEDIPQHPIETRWILRIDQAFRCALCGAKKRIKGGRETIKTNRESIASETCSHQWGALEGEWELRELPDFAEDFNAFLAAKTLWEWENEYWLRQIGY